MAVWISVSQLRHVMETTIIIPRQLAQHFPAHRMQYFFTRCAYLYCCSALQTIEQHEKTFARQTNTCNYPHLHVKTETGTCSEKHQFFIKASSDSSSRARANMTLAGPGSVCLLLQVMLICVCQVPIQQHWRPSTPWEAWISNIHVNEIEAY